jgi:hypothetical protein
MRSIAVRAVGIVLALGLPFAALAAEMTAAEIKQLVTGKSVYLDLEATSAGSGGKATLFYTADGKATLKRPSGELWHGTWTIKDNTVCIDWKEMPNNPCTRFEKQGDVITIINVATGKPRGTIAKVVDGNPENL